MSLGEPELILRGMAGRWLTAARFVRECCYSTHEILDRAYCLANPHSFHRTEKVIADFRSYPWQPNRSSHQQA